MGAGLLQLADGQMVESVLLLRDGASVFSQVSRAGKSLAAHEFNRLLVADRGRARGLRARR